MSVTLVSVIALLHVLPLRVTAADGIQATGTPPARSGNRPTPVIARVLSVEPFHVEILDDLTRKDALPYSQRPFLERVRHSPEDVRGLRYGDIISAHTYFYFYDAGELAAGTGLKDIRRLGRAAAARYEKRGFLLYYAPARGRHHADRLTVYRDGTLLFDDKLGNHLSNKRLSEAELRRLRGLYLTEQIGRLPSGVGAAEHGPRLVLSVGAYQRLEVVSPPANLQNFLSLLDSLVDRHIGGATYRIGYHRRAAIRDWRFGHILPLDAAAGADGPAYLQRNLERLGRVRPSPAFFKEAEDYGRGAGAFYRYKGRLYSFAFPQCTDRPTGSWACYHATELPPGGLGDGHFGYAEWPRNLRLRLSRVGRGGANIPKDEYRRHREFYDSLLPGGRFMYMDGGFIFLGVRVTYRST